MAILPLHGINHAYIGRFAPSPTGPLHLGSLFTALASYLDAHAHHGKWLLRLDDLDTPRNQPGSVASILTTLETFGLQWDGEVYYQSQHLDAYAEHLAYLDKNGLTYRCECSRKTLSEQAFGDADSNKPNVYPGTCRNKLIAETTPHAIRIKVDADDLTFTDSLQGTLSHKLLQKDGDFILKRRDGIIAYQFAVVIDDYLQGINHVVRGCDLLEETPKQIYLQQILGFPTPAYMHVPVIVDQHGYKLSKQTLATAVDTKISNKTLFNLLVLLKQNPPDELYGVAVNELLYWGIANWQPDDLSLYFVIPA